MTTSHPPVSAWEQFSGPLGGSGAEGSSQPETAAAMDAYFECITTCSLEDGECVTRCVEELRSQP